MKITFDIEVQPLKVPTQVQVSVPSAWQGMTSTSPGTFYLNLGELTDAQIENLLLTFTAEVRNIAKAQREVPPKENLKPAGQGSYPARSLNDYIRDLEKKATPVRPPWQDKIWPTPSFPLPHFPGARYPEAGQDFIDELNFQPAPPILNGKATALPLTELPLPSLVLKTVPSLRPSLSNPGTEFP